VTRPPEIVRWEDLEKGDWRYEGSDEAMGRDADLGRHFGFAALGFHHVRLPPGRRTSFPHAESHEDEIVFVLAGTPDVWLDGVLHRLAPGDCVGFRAGTGVAHSVLNNSDSDVRLIVAGDMPRAENQVVYPLNPDRKPLREDWWADAPVRSLGPHDGLTDQARAAKAKR
jgi:uncharacterized cupin superfamily protein